MPTPQETALKKALTKFTGSIANREASVFFSETMDFRASGSLVRGADRVKTATEEALKLRSSAEHVSLRFLNADFALVDTTFEADGGKGWFTEIWRNDGNAFSLRAMRMRLGKSSTALAALDRQAPETLGDNIQPAVQKREEAALRAKFKEFRAAFNGGKKEAILKLCGPNCDAIPVFSFLQGRAQILQGRSAIGSKADRMFGADVSNPNPTATQRSTFLGGEPKVIRFLSSTLAVVDGTAEIGNIPSAHGFAPKEMKGVYSNVWRKSGTQWVCEGARAWF